MRIDLSDKDTLLGVWDALQQYLDNDANDPHGENAEKLPTGAEARYGAVAALVEKIEEHASGMTFSD